jgi:hypothetical protein
MKRILGAGVVFALASYAAAQSDQANPRALVQHPVHFDTSRPLRDIAPELPLFTAPHERPRPLPFHASGLASDSSDPIAQKSASVLVAATPGLSFAGVGQGDYGFSPDAAPPDTNGTVGATQYVQWVNESFAVFDKMTGAKIYGPAAGNTLWSGFGGGCQSNNDGDPIVQYDKIHGRWVMSQFSVSTKPYLQCFAVSQTSDATGSWNRYAFTEPNFNDYPKIGIWSDGYYATYNMFSGNSFAGGRACAYDGAAMRAGTAAKEVCFQLSSAYGGLLPADVDTAAAQPAAGSPEYFLNFGSSSLHVWKLHADFATPANSTFTGPTTLSVAAFSEACSGLACVPQPGTTQQLDSLGDRLMYRLAYSKVGTQESLVVNHSVKVSGTKKTEVDGVRWYEVRINTATGATPTVFQQGTFSPDAASRWMGSIARDKAGNIALGYSVSSGAVRPSLRFTGRAPGDTAGTMQAETDMFDGTGSQQRGLNRWGDYSNISLDPVDGCTLWYTNEYLKANGTFNWSTWIASFKMAGCQ